MGGFFMAKKFENFKIGKKLSTSFTIVIACFMISILVCIVGIFTISSKLSSFYNTSYRNHVVAERSCTYINDAIKNLLLLSTTADQAENEALNKKN